MKSYKSKISRIIGASGLIVVSALFISRPSFPTPDKLIVFFFFGFLAFGQLREGIKRFTPFVFLILLYESFRSVADQLNGSVQYSLAPHFDKLLFGNLPTVYIQNWLWQGHVVWYDFALYIPYFFHFAIPLVLGVIVWKTKERYFWRVMNTFLVVAFGAFITYLFFPSAPPWLASQNNYIQPIVRISSDVWFSLGIKDFPSVYNHIAPNPVAAIPSLHAAWATLLVIFVYKIYGYRWSLAAAIYPLLIYIGTIYEGEHYFFDIVAGILYAVGAYYATPYIMIFLHKTYRVLTDKLPSPITEFTSKIVKKLGF